MDPCTRFLCIVQRKVRKNQYIKNPLAVYILPFILRHTDSAAGLLDGNMADQAHLNKISCRIPGRGAQYSAEEAPRYYKNVTKRLE